jgi:hypothetical protein
LPSAGIIGQNNSEVVVGRVNKALVDIYYICYSPFIGAQGLFLSVAQSRSFIAHSKHLLLELGRTQADGMR